LRVLPIDPVADTAQPREVAQPLRRDGSAGHCEIVARRAGGAQRRWCQRPGGRTLGA
jgi:hypothetical protein